MILPFMILPILCGFPGSVVLELPVSPLDMIGIERQIWGYDA